jgi:hypothetical protein
MARRISNGSMVFLFVVVSGVALVAQRGHFVTGGANAPICTDEGLVVSCQGTVAGLGGTTFEITVAASGTAIVDCQNPGGNVAPGQATTFEGAGGTGELPTPQNGRYDFPDLRTLEPGPLPPEPTCPNEQWVPIITDVVFTSPATVTLFEDGVQVDQITVPIGSS